MGWMEMLVVVLLPIMVALVTKEMASPGVKAVTLAALAGVAAVGHAWLNNKGLLTEVVVQDAVRNFVVAVATYFGFWKPTMVTDRVQESTGHLGVG